MPVNNNYSFVDGLQLDLLPEVGTINVKTVIIDKNDNAEGLVQFTEAGMEVTAYEHDTVVQVCI